MVIRLRDREAYLTALDRASIETDIDPFVTLRAYRVRWALERQELKFPERVEKFDFDCGVVLLSFFMDRTEKPGCGAP